MNETDLRLLGRVIELAWLCREHGNRPFGALLADERGQILMEAESTYTTDRNCTHHSETLIAGRASEQYSPQFLARCTLYTSGEPCAMCAGAIHWSNIGRVVFALSQADLYAITGPLPHNLPLPSREIFSRSSHNIEVLGPAPELAEEARAVHAGFWTSH